MALIECADCGTQISDRASVCIKCGAPAAAAPSAVPPAVVVAPQHIFTTQQTSKPYKAAQLIGGVLLSVGIVMAIGGGGATAGYTMFAGLVLYLGARFGAWWTNG